MNGGLRFVDTGSVGMCSHHLGGPVGRGGGAHPDIRYSHCEMNFQWNLWF